jgi:hypothetical protein
MAKDHGPSVKDDKQYEGLRKKGMSKSRAARIANDPNSSSKGGNEARGDEQGRREGRADPHPDAVGADDELADRPAQAAPARALVDLAGPGVVVVAGERRADGARHAVLGDEPRRLVRGNGHERQVARVHALGQLAVGSAEPGREGPCQRGERPYEHGVAAERALLRWRMASQHVEIGCRRSHVSCGVPRDPGRVHARQ